MLTIKMLVVWASGSNLKMLARAEPLSHDMSVERDLGDRKLLLESVSQDPSQALYASAVQ